MVMEMKKQKIAFIVFIAITLAFLAFSLFCFVNLTLIDKYPSSEELTYEQCTYIKSEYVSVGRGYHNYYIYVEEYNEPLKIDNIVINRTNEELLFSLNKGDTIIVSIYDNGKLDLFSVSYNNDYILSYEDYLTEHNGNNTVGKISTAVMSCIALGFLVGESIYYKKTGECLPL